MCALFGKDGNKDGKNKKLSGDISTPALRMTIEGQERDVSFAELVISNNLSQQALTRILIKKNIITAAELLEAMKEVRSESYREDK